MITFIRQRRTRLIAAALSAAALLVCCGCSDDNIGGAILERKIKNAPRYTLTTTVSPYTNYGSVSRDIVQDKYISGTVVTLTATAAGGYKFTGWTGASTSNSQQVRITMDGDKTVTANFESQTANPATYTLTVTKSHDGAGTTTPAGSQSNISAGTSVNLSTTVNSGYTFSNWTVTSGSATISNANSATGASVVVNGNVTVRANFQQQSGGGGDSYESVTIGGKTWMKKNLNIETANSWCYLNRSDSCAKYGRLYTWDAAKTACPAGWHLPTRDEWDHLAESVGGTKSSSYGTYHDWLNAGKALKSTTGWYNNGNGADTYGFSALPGGSRFSDGAFSYAGYDGGWWTATERSGEGAYGRYMNYGLDGVYEYDYYKSYGFAVRCLAD